MRDTRLKFNFLRVGGRTNTTVCLCYIDGLCPGPLVDEMRTRLSVLELDSVLDANYIAECLCDHRFSPFPTLGTTERPDVAASRLLEGRCALVVDGSPVVLTAPHLLQECFQSNDDYYISFLRTNVSRVLRTLGFFCSVTIPAVYTALLLYHRELVPARLLFAITAAQRGVPLPVGWEVLLLLFVLEVLREAGARTPGAMGQTMSIVGGLVLGQAAVSARFSAAPTVIVVAVAGVTGLMAPRLQTAALWLRFALLGAAAAGGLYGVGLALSLTLVLLCRMSSCGVPYLINLVPRFYDATQGEVLVDGVNVRDYKLKALHDIAVKDYPGLPYFVFGHSWGSMLGRAYAALYGDDLKGLMLCGVVSQFKGCEIELHDPAIKAAVTADPYQPVGDWFGKVFLDMTARIENPNGPSDWIACNPDIVADHAGDMFNGFDVTLELVWDLVELYGFIERREWAEMVPSSLPVYLISGDCDPCGNYGEGLYHVANLLAESGNKVSVKAYSGYRHEIHNELELRDEVEAGLVGFVNGVKSEAKRS